MNVYKKPNPDNLRMYVKCGNHSGIRNYLELQTNRNVLCIGVMLPYLGTEQFVDSIRNWNSEWCREYGEDEIDVIIDTHINEGQVVYDKLQMFSQINNFACPINIEIVYGDCNTLA